MNKNNNNNRKMHNKIFLNFTKMWFAKGFYAPVKRARPLAGIRKVYWPNAELLYNSL